MEWAELVLEYVRALAWPAVVGGAVFAFRSQIASKIGDLKEATTPVGGASFFDREARAIEEEAERAAERQKRTEPPPATTEPIAEEPAVAPGPGDVKPETKAEPQDEDAARTKALQEAIDRQLERRGTFLALSQAVAELEPLPDFSVARGIAVDSPRAAVMLAYADLEKVARAALTVAEMKPPGRVFGAQVIQRLLRTGSLTDEFAAVARNLSNLRARVAHGDPETPDISTSGALDFIGACEQLTIALEHGATSRLRHPSRMPLVMEWMAWEEAEQCGRQESGGEPNPGSREGADD